MTKLLAAREFGTYGRTDRRTDGRTIRRIYAPPNVFGEQKKQRNIIDEQQDHQRKAAFNEHNPT
jgi:hypothetical protein